MRNAQHYIADEQVIEIVDIELAQRQAVQETQERVVFYHIMNSCQLEACVKHIGPTQTY